MGQNELVKIYETVLRPSAEYSSIIYGPLIPEYISTKLESVQRQAYKIIHGWDVDYEGLVAGGTVETLKKRRAEATLRFAIKTAASPRFGPTWYKENVVVNREVRATTRNKYVEQKCRTERGRNNPLNVLTRVLNEHHRSNQS